MSDETNQGPGTGALEKSDAAAAAVQKGVRVTLDDLRANIANCYYLSGAVAHAFDPEESAEQEAANSAALALLTLCILVTRSGFTVVGQSACADAANFDPDVGRRLAREAAERELWGFMGYALRERLHQATP